METTAKKVEVMMEYVKSTPNMNVYQCKGLAVITSIYIHKSFSDGMKNVKVTVEQV